MTVRVTRCDLVIIVDAMGEEVAARNLVDALMVAMGDAGRPVRQLPGRIYVTPADGNVGTLAERTRAWLARKGCEVAVADW